MLKYAYNSKKFKKRENATLVPELCYVVILLFLFPRDVLQLVEQL